ncbi:MAG TPA: ATP-binding protein [Bryobacteraceae bacterium]|jgi:light-regulated signal transduction histidine kinase (bacteriophytochrome)|nr:ATP-binding protein [Bryobacteraceae bacterium]
MPTEAELAQALRETAELKTALEECSSAQNAARAAAEGAVKELHDFVYATSHDLQEPLRAISAYAQLLQRKYAEDAETSELTGFIVHGAKQVTGLLQALLAYSRAGNSPRRSMVKLSSIVQSARYKLNDRIRESGANVVCGDLPEVLADQTQLSQVFEQLFANAVTYRSGEPPVIEITAEEGDEEHTISIRDNGKGIEPRFHEQIFLPFKRLHGKEVPGAGLGLAVCRKIIAAHGGQIWVESSGEQGSSFKFTIPF